MRREYAVQNEDKFISAAHIKQSLPSMLKFPVESFGYIEPGHRLKGKQQCIVQDGDLKEL